MAQADATHQEPSRTEHLRRPEHRGPGLAPSWDRPRKTASAHLSAEPRQGAFWGSLAQVYGLVYLPYSSINKCD